MFKLKTKISALILVPMILLSTIGISAKDTSETEEFNEEKIRESIYSVYDDALDDYGTYSFAGMCNVAVAYQLKMLGIFADREPDFIGNGNQWYFHFNNYEDEKTSGGYTVHTFGGGDCLYDLVNEYGDNLYNVVVSFGTGGASGDTHVVLIRAIHDSKVYYTDNFYYGQLHSEGSPCVISLDYFMSIYNEMNGTPYGCVYFEKEKEKPTEMSLAVECGDLDADGKVSVADARKILLFSARQITLNDFELKKADVNFDGKVTSEDARLALKMSAKKM